MGDVFPERLRRLREKKRVSARVLSGLCGISENCISLYERGTEPGLKALVAIADYLDVSIDYLVGLTDNPERND